MSSETPRKVRPWDLLTKYVPGAAPSRASDEDAAARLTICEGCPMLRKRTTRKGVKGTCSQCGCFMSEKVKLAAATCPLGKWGAVEAVA